MCIPRSASPCRTGTARAAQLSAAEHPSGLNAHYTLDALVAELRALREALRGV